MPKSTIIGIESVPKSGLKGNNMALIVEVDKKTGRNKYKVRYWWHDADNKLKDSKTGWFETQELAEKEADKLKFLKEKEARNEFTNRREQPISYIFDVWIEELEKSAHRETTENTTTEKTTYNKARTVQKYYTPEKIAKTKIKDIDETTFRMWLTHINSQKIAGRTIRWYRTILTKFNQFLGNNGYYTDPDLDRRIDTTISRTHIKPKSAGERKDRRIPTIQDIEKLGSYYHSKGLSDFKNLYWFTLWHTLFYSGLRISELIGLQWKFVDLNRDTMDIRNSISERELKDNVLNRVSQEIYHTKNPRSERIIPIFDKYSQLLADYKTNYKFHFHLTDKEMKDCFVFPMVLQTKEDPMIFQKQKNILRELKRACEEAGVEETDVQMMRHGCATWMVSDYADGGLGFSESQAKDYFGHTGDDMLREVYSKLNKKQTARRTITTFSSLMTNKPREESKEVSELQELSDLVLHPELNQPKIEEARQDRIYETLMKFYRQNRTKYEFYDDEFGDLMMVCARLNQEGSDLLDKIDLIWHHNGKEEKANYLFKTLK